MMRRISQPKTHLGLLVIDDANDVVLVSQLFALFHQSLGVL